MAIKCEWHDHPLQIRSVLSNSQSRCFVCLQSVSGYNYRCSDCNFFIHIACLKLPVQSLHPLHQNHPLSLLTNPPHTSSHNSPQILCNYCKILLCSGFTYHCALCSYSLHLNCALKQNTSKLEIHNHPLTFFPYPFGGFESFRCNICADLGYGFCLACKACDFVIHLECSTHPVIVKSPRHRHQLSLASVRSIDDGSGEFYCDLVCEGKVNPKASVYYCAECNYMAHLECLSFVPKPHIKFSYKNVDVNSFGTFHERKHETGQSDNIHGLSEPHIGQAEDDGITKMRQHFSELRIVEKAQSNQRSELEHFSHQHPLTLIAISATISSTDGVASCLKKHHSSTPSRPHSHSSYTGATKGLYVQSLRRTFVTASHLLTLASPTFKCATLPYKIRHKCHVDPLFFAFVPVEDDDSDEFYCDACEQLRDPKHWVYYCADCEYSAHMNCVVSELLGGYRSPGLLNYDHHEHLLDLKILRQEINRARAIFELAISQPALDKTEYIWKKHIDFELKNNRGRARELYETLLERTKHMKERVKLLDEWQKMESGFGELGDVESVRAKQPRKIKRRPLIEAKYSLEAYEEYLDYLFPEEIQTGHLKLSRLHITGRSKKCLIWQSFRYLFHSTS
ncbi:crooked neck protein, putative [Actinidia rufa]|uniref:Crooked neck protein, putative n=1 Tax=Actinidia rufa TaxID=165716 RepID=A0A7J0GTY4_9ERIC|nr:crooked neck protein, putative [Actinidia rufa]